MEPRLSVKGSELCLDGKPYRILSGAMHYFRIHPDLWEDRLRKCKAMGLNTLETYAPWNLHEPAPGEWNFDGFCDVERYFAIASDLGLKILFRPGPYICSEWDFGGLPAWLAAIPGIRLRCCNEPYLQCAERYLREICRRVRPFAGPSGALIGVQVENEYGSYGNDKEYLRRLSRIMAEELPGVFQFTSDGPEQVMMESGTLPELFAMGNFGSEPEEAFDFMERFRPGSPKMCGEYWNGWFDHWGEKHHARDPQDAADHLRRMLEAGGHVNIYMFHGGTNFGWMNGANYSWKTKYQPTVTSYDDDAPLNEHGAVTRKYHLFREILARFNPEFDPATPIPPDCPVRAYGKVALTESALLFDNLEQLSQAHFCGAPPTMEELGQSYGFILYRQILNRTIGGEVTVDRPLDRAQIFLNGEEKAVVTDMESQHSAALTARPGDQLDILVENMGRVNYGAHMESDCRKGICGSVRTCNQQLFGWQVYPLAFQDLSGLQYQPVQTPLDGPCFYRGEFSVEEAADTFLAVPGKKGMAWINGFLLGRYWEIGPTGTLYIPAPLLRQGKNCIEILELHRLDAPEVTLQDVPVL